jgi:hypothetical protein
MISFASLSRPFRFGVGLMMLCMSSHNTTTTMAMVQILERPRPKGTEPPVPPVLPHAPATADSSPFVSVMQQVAAVTRRRTLGGNDERTPTRDADDEEILARIRRHFSVQRCVTRWELKRQRQQRDGMHHPEVTRVGKATRVASLTGVASPTRGDYMEVDSAAIAPGGGNCCAIEGGYPPITVLSLHAGNLWRDW